MTLCSRLPRCFALSALMAAVLIAGSTATAPLASAKSQVPFRASIFEQFGPIDCALTPFAATAFFCATTTPGTGVGHATHLGRVTQPHHLTGVIGQDPTTQCFTETKLMTLRAANSDQVFFSLAGTACSDGTGSGTYRITDGTGRFSGAKGTGTFQETYTFDPNTGTGSDSNVYTGTISSPGFNQ